MKNYRLVNRISFVSIVITIAIISLGFLEGDKRGQQINHNQNVLAKSNTSGKNGDAYVLEINNITLPMNNRGVIANVAVGDAVDNGTFGGNTFLFSGGFFLTGYANGELWGNAVASASLIENYIAGLAGGDAGDSRAVLYVVNNEDEPFGESWQDWKDAVDLGADFYDGDGDSVYNPRDLNGNGSWDPDEDSPDLLGDETVWCVYNDGQPLAQRLRFAGIRPLGIEVRQTVFGFASAGAIGNIIFVRYRLKNTGTVADTLTEVLFGAWADPDLGDFNDDLVGVDTTRNAGFTYNSGSDQQYGINPPCFVIDFFSGPIAYIPDETFTDANQNGVFDEGEEILDTAYSIRGQRIGIVEYLGARNLGVSSFVHYQQSDPQLGDPNTQNEARNYMLGLDRLGEEPDPCDWALGTVEGGVDCSLIDPRFWYSGDPTANNGEGYGWINSAATDQRQMQNTGPFQLIKDVELEIVVAYVVGQGADALSSITQALAIDDGAQFIFDHNFESPSPGPSITGDRLMVETGEDFIDLIWDTAPQTNFVNETDAYELRFEGYNIFAFRTNITQEEVELQINKRLIGSFDQEDFIQNVYTEVGPGEFELTYPFNADNQLDSAVYISDEGRIRFRIRRDPFTNTDLVKGRPYYFAVTGYYLNWDALRYRNSPVPDSLGVTGDYYLSQELLVGSSENIPKITTVVLADDLYDPPIDLISANHVSGFSSGDLVYDVYNKDELTGDEYEVTFFHDSAATSYLPFWKLRNITTNTVLLDSVNSYLYTNTEVALPEFQTEGFITRISNERPRLGSMIIDEDQPWIDQDFTIYYYVSFDIPPAQRPTVANIPANLPSISSGSTIETANKVRRVEIRFDGTGQKAYRYLNGFVKDNFLASSAKFTYVWAGEVTEEDTARGGAIGKFGEGFVDVPFSVWVEDGRYGERRQLACGFIESGKRFQLNGNPDGIWDPDTNLFFSREYIIIFDEDYDPLGNQIVYKGGTYIGGDESNRADLRGYEVPDNSLLTEEEKRIAESPYFNAMYVLGIQRLKDTDNFYTTGDMITIPISNYPYTEADVFRFSTVKDGKLLESEEKALWNKVTVYPNPLFGFNVATSYDNSPADAPFVTFSNLPRDITVKIYTLSGILIRTLGTEDKSSPTSPFLRWDLQNESGLRAASGMYIALISSPKFGDKVLKFAIVMPQKQLPKY